jgi:AcrR family transcriptional regulator
MIFAICLLSRFRLLSPRTHGSHTCRNIGFGANTIFISKPSSYAALLALLKEKPLSAISISELTSKAAIGRVSFYRNYQNKEDILKEESDRLIREWGRLYEANPESAPETLFPSLFDFYRDHRDFYTILYNSGMSSIMMETTIGTIQITPEMQNLEAYMKSFWAYGIYGWLLEWIKRGMPESGKELSALFSLARQN